ncbi:MAG TPA: NACHT domain-containing protein [Gammaproteobacteria bacterium]|nr:NACHT domain-containing protein [Gammaproteobacteria bacterium]
MSKYNPDDVVFENEVRRIARELWPSAQYEGAAIIDGQERDGVFETEECIHLLEATTSRRKDKAEKDINKMVALAKNLQKESQWKAVKCWFVTREEPTADQRSVANKHRGLVSAISFTQLQSKLIDVGTYLTLRDKYPFGSVRDPETGDINPTVEYIPLDLIETKTSEIWSTNQICGSLLEKGRFIILGDYGAGKSMTLRKLYQELRKQYFRNKTHLFPVFINLRDHYGQTNESEILERHARLIGFPNPSHIVRAWRAGYVILLIDGIDEIATTGIQGLWKKLQDTRYRAMQGVRELVRNHPKSVGITLAGRAHFFDSEKERIRALGLSNNFHQLSLNEFSDDQIRIYLEKSGFAGNIPSWLPTRPLLIGYLASRNVLGELVSSVDTRNKECLLSNPQDGWNYLLDRVSDREAEIEAGIDGETVRKILERLATLARTSQDGLGPLTPEQIVEAFKQVCGYSPDEKGMVLLQRLPGLGIDRSDEETRKFVDVAFADCCRAGDVFVYLSYPYDFNFALFENAECGLGELGLGIVCVKLNQQEIAPAKANAAIDYGQNHGAPPILISDACRAIMSNGWDLSVNVIVSGVFLSDFVLDEEMPDVSRLLFNDCYFSKIYISYELSKDKLPSFKSCYFGEIEGRRSIRDLPKDIFDDNCVFDSFVGSEKTTQAIIESDLPLGVKVLLTILKKLYQQAGSGRKEKALVSGLDHHARRLVSDVIKILQSESLAIPYKRGNLFLWLPNRNYVSRVARIISAPNECGDIVVEKCKDIA